MARGTPGTAGSKGGGNVIPSNQMRIGDNSYRGPSPFGSQRQISPRGYTNIFSAPRQPTPPRFGGRGGSSGILPYGSDSLIGIPPFRRPPPSRYPGSYMPSPSNRFLAPLPRPRNSYNPPPNQYGGMRGPSGLAGFLANQPAIRQVEIDPATGFFTQNQVEKDAAARAAAEAAAQAERDRLEQEANQQAPVPEADPAPQTRDELDARFATMQAQRAAQGVDPTRSSGKAGSKGGASTVPVGGQNNIASKSLSSGVSKGGGMGGTSMPASRGPNIRPAMGFGKATGGPVGLASLAGRY